MQNSEQIAIEVKTLKELTDILLANDPSKTNIFLQNYIGLFNTEQAYISDQSWEEFCEALASNTSLKTFCFHIYEDVESGTPCNLFKYDRWEAFCKAMGSNNSLQNLTLSQFRFTLNAWRSLWVHTIGKENSLKSLNLSWSFLQTLDASDDVSTFWSIFFEVFNKNQSLIDLKLFGAGIPFRFPNYEINQIFEVRKIQIHVALLVIASHLRKKSNSNHLIKYMLSFMTPSQSLTQQVLMEIENHSKKIEQFAVTQKLMEEATARLSKNDPSLRELNLSNRELSRLGESQWEAFCLALSSNKNLEKLDLQGASLPLINLKSWNLFCTAISQQHSILMLNLTQCVNKTIIDHPLQASDGTTSRCWDDFYSALASNRSITELNLSNNLGLGLGFSPWRKCYNENCTFRKVLKENCALRVLNISNTDYESRDYYLPVACKNIEESSSIYHIISESNLEDKSMVLETNRKISVKGRFFRHRAAIAFAQGLHNTKLPRPLIKLILTFFDTQRLADRVIIDLEEHAINKMLIECQYSLHTESDKMSEEGHTIKRRYYTKFIENTSPDKTTKPAPK